MADAAERAMDDLYEEIEAMRNKIMELENEICDTKRVSDEDKARLDEMLISCEGHGHFHG